MAILYRVVARKNPQNHSQKLYYLQARKRGTLDFEDMLIRATEDTTLDPDELRLSLARAFKKTEEYLSEGFTVNFGTLGYMKTTLTSVGAPNIGAAKPSMLKRIRTHFIFGKLFSNFMQTVGLEEIK